MKNVPILIGKKVTKQVLALVIDQINSQIDNKLQTLDGAKFGYVIRDMRALFRHD